MSQEFNEKNYSLKMDKSIQSFKKDISTLRTGRANAAMLDAIKVDVYGQQMPINQIATINVPEARLISVQVWDQSNVKLIDSAIQKSDLGVNPQVDGQIIRISIPNLTEERRKDLIKILKGMGEYFPLIMKIEVQIIPMYANVPSWSELVNYLYKINYMTCEWIEIGKHATRTPAEMDMIFIPNYLTDFGKKIIMSREKEFISLMIIFGQIKLLQNVSSKLNFAANSEIQKLKDKFFQ